MNPESQSNIIAEENGQRFSKESFWPFFPLKVFTKTQKSGRIIYYGITMETRRKKLEKR